MGGSRCEPAATVIGQPSKEQGGREANVSGRLGCLSPPHLYGAAPALCGSQLNGTPGFRSWHLASCSAMALFVPPVAPRRGPQGGGRPCRVRLAPALRPVQSQARKRPNQKPRLCPANAPQKSTCGNLSVSPRRESGCPMTSATVTLPVAGSLSTGGAVHSPGGESLGMALEGRACGPALRESVPVTGAVTVTVTVHARGAGVKAHGPGRFLRVRVACPSRLGGRRRNLRAGARGRGRSGRG